MERPVFRNEDKLQKLAHREFLRQRMPPGGRGFVVEDLDLVVRLYGPNFGTDDTGKFMLIELKYGDASPDTAQQKTFGLIDKMLRLANPLVGNRYLGYHVLNYTDENWDRARFRWDRKEVSLAEVMLKLADGYSI